MPHSTLLRRVRNSATLALACLAGAAQGQPAQWVGFPGFGGSGGWAGAGNWAPAVIPNGPLADVTINVVNPAGYTVSMNIGSVTFGRLSVLQRSATLLVPGGSTMTCTGTIDVQSGLNIVNHGRVHLGSPSFPGGVTLAITASTVITGDGEIILGPTASTQPVVINASAAPSLLINQSVRGTGRIESPFLAVLAHGRITAQDGDLVLPPTIHNQGEIISGAAGVNGAAGTIRVEGSAIVGNGVLRNAAGNAPMPFNNAALSFGRMEGDFRVAAGATSRMVDASLMSGSSVSVAGAFELGGPVTVNGVIRGVGAPFATVHVPGFAAGAGSIVAEEGLLLLTGGGLISGLTVGASTPSAVLAWNGSQRATNCRFVGLTSVGLLATSTLRVIQGAIIEGVVQPSPSGQIVLDEQVHEPGDATLDGPGAVNLDAGAIRRGTAAAATVRCAVTGFGVIDGLSIRGVLSPSDTFGPVAPMALERDVRLDHGAAYECDLMVVPTGGVLQTAPSDRLVGGAGSSLRIDGVLRPRFVGGIVPDGPQQWEIARAETITTGPNLQYEFPEPPHTRQWLVEYADGAVTLRLACRADLNHDGGVDPDDLGDFINCFFQPECGEADFNFDGNIDPDDLGDYINLYFSPC